MTLPWADCRRTLAAHSRSFALAGRLLAPHRRDRLAAVYAWCRAADDAVDLSPPAEQPGRLAALRHGLDAIYAGQPQQTPAAVCFAAVVRETGIPMREPLALLDGLASDVSGAVYETIGDLRRYAFQMAGTVGLMACRVLGARSSQALLHAAHLGMAMQLTNVCRDVQEDWERGRLYVPAELLPRDTVAELRASRGRPLPERAVPALAAAVARLLDEADRYYRSGDRGLRWLDPRSRVAVGTARRVYAAIGREIRRRGHDVRAGRAVVPARRKLVCVLGAAAGAYGGA